MLFVVGVIGVTLERGQRGNARGCFDRRRESRESVSVKRTGQGEHKTREIAQTRNICRSG